MARSNDSKHDYSANDHSTTDTRGCARRLRRGLSRGGLALMLGAAVALVAPHAAAQDQPLPKKEAKKEAAPKKEAKKEATQAPKKEAKAPAKKPLTKEEIEARRAAQKAAAEKAAAQRAALIAAQKAAAEKAAAERAAQIAAAKAKAKAVTPPAAAAGPAAAGPAAAGTDAAPAAELVTTTKTVEVPAPTSLIDGFKDALEPHGSWIDDETYGTVWVPAEEEVGANFAPYRTHGRWAVTEDGQWAWASDKDWGRIPFHYGRWFWSKEHKWAWIPDDDYAPAHVVWRIGDPGYQFVGWAPMAPTHYWIDGAPVAQSSGVLPFTFVPSRHLFSPQMSEHVVTDSTLGKAVHAHSRLFEGHLGEEGATGSAPMQAASPSFGQARIPNVAIPATRLGLDADSVAPLSLPGLHSFLVSQVEGGVAAPPPGEAAPAEGDEAADAPGAAATPEAPEAAVSTPAVDDASSEKRFATPPKRKIHRARRGERGESRPRYRCWWTNTRPRIWRCGYVVN